jgi:hypothetical protein
MHAYFSFTFYIHISLQNFGFCILYSTSIHISLPFAFSSTLLILHFSYIFLQPFAFGSTLLIYLFHTYFRLPHPLCVIDSTSRIEHQPHIHISSIKFHVLTLFSYSHIHSTYVHSSHIYISITLCMSFHYMASL